MGAEKSCFQDTVFYIQGYLKEKRGKLLVIMNHFVSAYSTLYYKNSYHKPFFDNSLENCFVHSVFLKSAHLYSEQYYAF